ncbi:unnamed protein product [marine sediment metagenome]|uniref:Uncharacterized protein n=1 Tax=marine sediment metagenome TaxID=412755 RepID=X0TB17_9ZZZZ
MEQYQYLGYTFTEVPSGNSEDRINGTVEYAIESGSGMPLGTITRDQMDPDGAPSWGVTLYDVPSTKTWFTTRLKAIEYLKERTA